MQDQITDWLRLSKQYLQAHTAPSLCGYLSREERRSSVTTQFSKVGPPSRSNQYFHIATPSQRQITPESTAQARQEQKTLPKP